MKTLPILIKEICLADSKLNLISCKIFFEQVLFSVILNSKYEVAVKYIVSFFPI